MSERRRPWYLHKKAMIPVALALSVGAARNVQPAETPQQPTATIDEILQHGDQYLGEEVVLQGVADPIEQDVNTIAVGVTVNNTDRYVGIAVLEERKGCLLPDDEGLDLGKYSKIPLRCLPWIESGPALTPIYQRVGNPYLSDMKRGPVTMNGVVILNPNKRNTYDQPYAIQVTSRRRTDERKKTWRNKRPNRPA